MAPSGVRVGRERPVAEPEAASGSEYGASDIWRFWQGGHHMTHVLAWSVVPLLGAEEGAYCAEMAPLVREARQSAASAEGFCCVDGHAFGASE